jgi:YVTN family beta-propeller protein
MVRNLGKTGGLFWLSVALLLGMVVGIARPQMRRMREYMGPDRYVPPAAPRPAPPPSGPENYLSPAALAAAPDGRTLFVACATADRVLVVDVAAGQVVRAIQTPAPPTGLALSHDHRQVIVTCAAPQSVAIFADIATGRLVHSIRAGHTGNTPVLSPDGRMLFVCNRFADDVSFIDVAAARQVRRVEVQREPVGAAVTNDGRFLLVANHLHHGPADGNESAACVSVIDVAAGRVARELRLPNGSGLLHDLRISPDGRYACVTHLIGRHQLPTTQLDRGWMNTNALTVIDVTKMEIVNTVLLDGIGRGAANPWGLAWSADGKTLVVTHAGTHELTVIDFPALLASLADRKARDRFSNDPQSAIPNNVTGSEARQPPSPAPSAEVPNELSFLAGLSRRIPLPEGDRGPRALVLVGTKAYTANYFSDTLAVVDVARAQPQVQSIALGPKPQMSLMRRGEFYFHDATICFQGWQSCSSCHPGDARSDALNWDLLNDGIGNLKNARSLLNAHRISPSMSMGVRATAEVAIRAGISHILGIVQPEEVPQAIYAYVCSLQPVPSPHLIEGRLSESARRGEKLFRDADVGCATCHAFDLHTDQRRHEVGTRGRFDAPRDRFYTPTLVELWRTAPYLHDGSAATVRDVLTTKNPGDRHGRTSHLTEEQLDDLAEYLRSL